MRSAGRTIAVVVAVAVIAPLLALIGPSSAGAGDADPQRYLEEVFPVGDVVVTKDLLYHSTTDHNGDPIDLRLDLYEPKGDTAQQRPLVIFMHGGWFAFGSKNGMDVAAEEYVRRGYVVAAIDYRTNPDNGWGSFPSIDVALTDPVFFASIVAAFLDAQQAVGWLRDRADQYRIHPDAIVSAGHSAGAVLSLLLAYLYEGATFDETSENWNYRTAAAMPWAGTTLPAMIESGEPPAHVSHGTTDTTIPYLLGEVTCNAILAVGSTCELYTLNGVGHGLMSYRDEIIQSESEFLFAEVLAPLGFTTAVHPDPSFTDVDPGHAFYAEIQWAAGHEITNGFPDGTFGPDLVVPRQAAAAFAYRLAGSPAFVPPATPTFTDVPTTHPFFKEIEWAAANDVTDGYPDGSFGPARTLVRQAAAAFAYRLAGSPAFVPPATPTFTDVPTTHPFSKEIEWAAANDVTDGYPDGSFGPTRTLVRQAIAAFLCRLYEVL